MDGGATAHWCRPLVVAYNYGAPASTSPVCTPYVCASTYGQLAIRPPSPGAFTLSPPGPSRSAFTYTELQVLVRVLVQAYVVGSCPSACSTPLPFHLLVPPGCVDIDGSGGSRLRPIGYTIPSATPYTRSAQPLRSPFSSLLAAPSPRYCHHSRSRSRRRSGLRLVLPGRPRHTGPPRLPGRALSSWITPPARQRRSPRRDTPRGGLSWRPLTRLTVLDGTHQQPATADRPGPEPGAYGPATSLTVPHADPG